LNKLITTYSKTLNNERDGFLRKREVEGSETCEFNISEGVTGCEQRDVDPQNRSNMIETSCVKFKTRGERRVIREEDRVERREGNERRVRR